MVVFDGLGSFTLTGHAGVRQAQNRWLIGYV